MENTATPTRAVDPLQGLRAPAPTFFEDFVVGQRFSSSGRVITDADLEMFSQVSGDKHPLHCDPEFARTAGFQGAVLHGPFGQAAFLGWHYEAGMSDQVQAMLDSQWTYLKEIVPGDEIRFEMTITRTRRTSSGRHGVVGRHVEVTNQHGEVVQRGSTAALVRTRGSGNDESLGARAYCTPEWGRLLSERLQKDEVFTSSTATWDGALGLASDDGEVVLRIYQGSILSAGPRVPNGATFTLKASDQTWTDLLCGPTNDYMKRAMRGEFSVQGSAYEYLRLTKTVVALVECARSLAMEGELA
jgi:acyl dehydratase/putative sterol carrier protein